MDKFKLTPLPSLMWTVEDKERGIKVSFREGLFNETQEVELKDNKKGMETAAKAMREIGEWLASEHHDVAVRLQGAGKSLEVFWRMATVNHHSCPQLCNRGLARE